MPAGGGAMREEIPITPADLDQFGQLLAGIQASWSRMDLNGMRRMVTPEMLSYFSEQLSDLTSRGLENRVDNVTLLKGDVLESWDEGNAQFCTVKMRWSATDVTVRRDNGQVVEGDPNRPSEATETWTFVRARGGSWILSAIQQG
jgi:predicted lipid-binding transport protein (Tim44 family)